VGIRERRGNGESGQGCRLPGASIPTPRAHNNPLRTTPLLFPKGSDGSNQEGDNAEAARLAVAQNLNVKLIVDDNDVTIAGFPSDYMKGFDVAKTLTGHGLPCHTVCTATLSQHWVNLD
jgi:transketolase N-terminal domain/subunit